MPYTDKLIAKGAGRFAISLLALAKLFIAFVAYPDTHRGNGDTPVYLEMGAAIARGQPIAGYQNGYALVIAGFERVGLHGPPLDTVLVLLNVAMAVATTVLVYRLAVATSGNATAAFIAAACFAFYPNQQPSVGRIMTEVLSALLVSAGIALLLTRRAASAAALLVGAGFTRTSIVLVPLAIAAVLLRRKPAVFARFCIGCAVTYVTIAGLYLAHVIEPSNATGTNLLISAHSDSRAPDFDALEEPRVSTADGLKSYLRCAIDEPLQFAKQRFWALWNLWGPWPIDDTHNWMERAAIGLRFPLIALTLMSWWRHRRDWQVTCLAAPIFALTAVHVMSFSSPRLTFPVEPLCFVLLSRLACDIVRGQTSSTIGPSSMSSTMGPPSMSCTISSRS
jgi:hypothetical protein